MPTPDELIGRTVREVRERQKLSQADVARAMTERGTSAFYPQTILKIEKGERSLKLHEAAMLSQVLEVTIEDLIGDLGDAVTSLRFNQLAHLISSSKREIEDGIYRILSARDEIKQIAEKMAVEMPASKEEARELSAKDPSDRSSTLHFMLSNLFDVDRITELAKLQYAHAKSQPETAAYADRIRRAISRGEHPEEA